MAEANTMRYDELILEVEWVAASGTYAKICGITDVSITRTLNTTDTEIPDCDDETKPHAIRRTARSIDVSVSGTGVWALQSHQNIHDWFYSGAKKSVRLRNAKAAAATAGTPYVEQGDAFLTQLNNERPGDKGVITASIALAFDGTPAVTDVSA